MHRLIIFSILILLYGCQNENVKLESDWSDSDLERNWAGPDYWTNPLQSWLLKDGKMNCTVSGGDRNIISLTTELNEDISPFYMEVDIQKNVENGNSNDEGWVGFLLGRKGEFNDYRDDAVKGIGLCAGWSSDGKLFIGDLTQSTSIEAIGEGAYNLYVSGEPADSEDYLLKITVKDQQEKEIGSHSEVVHGSWLQGLLGIACSTAFPDTLDYTSMRPSFNLLKELKKSEGGNNKYSFNNWKMGGDKLDLHQDRSYGPILWTQHTLSQNVLKMNVQMAPLGSDLKEVSLIVDGAPLNTVQINPDGYVANFKIVNWNSIIDHPYAIEYTSSNGKVYTYEGVIKKEPLKDIVRLASLSCVDDVGFPHQDLVDNLTVQEADLFVFHGDQLYERVGGYGVERNSELDYLRKWYMFGWTFRDLMRDHPTIIIPDDHDVFHGNLWGEGGKRADVSLGYGYDSQDSGGYKEPASFVNIVHRTQTGHLPDPPDNRPVKQGISVYFTSMVYGGISFAILGDRQWKSAPKPLFPDAEIENGWPQNKSWNPKTDAFHPSAQLLGERQEKFLESWVDKWESGVVFKTVISQSPFCNVATLPADIYHDKYVPTLPRHKLGEYPPDDRPVADFDSNGWPKNKRDKALEIMRKGLALHITGDQHLGSTGQYGIKEYGDAGYWVSTPAVSNLWPRRWFPAQEPDGGRRSGDLRKYTGNYEDGFGNKMSIKAVANPYDLEKEPGKIYDKAPGYSIIDYYRLERRMRVAVWPRWAAPDKASPDHIPFKGWPLIIDPYANLVSRYKYKLDRVSVDGNTIMKVYEKGSNNLVYAFRPPSGTFLPPVPEKKTYYIITYAANGSKRMISNIKAK
ncbi:MAG: twin-arginine translocation pathway signal protein [Saprospiraceae bacterium]|nr:twin-arginine translocation pathway signal protein [Saprospiraceae bacterium]